MQRPMRYILLALTTATLLLTGCAGFAPAPSSTGPTQIHFSALNGNVHGGQNPITGATVQVYAAGTTGTYGTGATALIPTANASCTSNQSPTCYYLGGAPGCVAGNGQTCYTNVVTDGGGYFNITGDYSCTSGSELYITATGGNPGSGVNNSVIQLSGFGLCDNLPNVTFLLLNEVTTVGTAFALAQFMSDSYNASTQTGYINIGAPASNVTGLKEAFADINTLVNYANGSSPGPAAGSGAVVPAGTVVPSQQIYAIANSLAACVNTNGSGACTGSFGLFGLTTVNGVAPSDTAGACLNIAKHPTVNANNILDLTYPAAPFATTFISANDLSLAITYTGNGISAPSGVAVDASGNVWVANSTGNSVTELAHNGSPVGNSPFTTGGITAPTALAVDNSGYVWIANSNSTLTQLSSSGSSVGSSPFSGGGLSSPTSVAVDGLGDIWLSNSGNNSVSEFSSSGTALSPAGTGYVAIGLTSPVGVAINPQ